MPERVEQPAVSATQAIAAADSGDQLVAWIGDDSLPVDQMIIIVRNQDVSPTELAVGQTVRLECGSQSLQLTSLNAATIEGGGNAAIYFVATAQSPARA